MVYLIISIVGRFGGLEGRIECLLKCAANVLYLLFCLTVCVLWEIKWYKTPY